jgi:catechol 2,3-dioxygenase-like lactoylglutathione lyase family enzyme
MISGGNATVYVSNMDAAVQFYTETLGLTLTNRFGNHWATLETGTCFWTHGEAGLTIGLHPASPKRPAPGTAGGVGFGLETYLPIEQVAALLSTRGVTITSEIIRYEAGNVFMFTDLDGLPTYINEFPPNMLPESDLGTNRSKQAAPSSELVAGGHAIVYVSNMDAGVRFYSEKLGLTLTNRYGDQFATVEAGKFLLAIHPKTARTPDPGKKGSVAIGFQVDEPMDRVVSRLTERGVRMTGNVPPDSERLIELEDEDGNAIYLWEATAATARVAASR